MLRLGHEENLVCACEASGSLDTPTLGLKAHVLCDFRLQQRVGPGERCSRSGSGVHPQAYQSRAKENWEPNNGKQAVSSLDVRQSFVSCLRANGKPSVSPRLHTITRLSLRQDHRVHAPRDGESDGLVNVALAHCARQEAPTSDAWVRAPCLPLQSPSTPITKSQ